MARIARTIVALVLPFVGCERTPQPGMIPWYQPYDQPDKLGYAHEMHKEMEFPKVPYPRDVERMVSDVRTHKMPKYEIRYEQLRVPGVFDIKYNWSGIIHLTALNPSTRPYAVTGHSNFSFHKIENFNTATWRRVIVTPRIADDAITIKLFPEIPHMYDHHEGKNIDPAPLLAETLPLLNEAAARYSFQSPREPQDLLFVKK